MKKHSSGNFNDFYRYNQKCQDKLTKLTDPLKTAFGIDIFWHITLHENGLFSNVCNFYDQWGYFWENQCYKNAKYFIAPSILKSGHYLLEFDPDFIKVQETLKEEHPLNHPFIVIRKENNEKAHIFGFATSGNIATLPSFYTNNLPIINRYIDYFLKANPTSSNVPDEKMLHISDLVGLDSYYKKSYGDKVLRSTNVNCSFLKKLGVNPNFLEIAAQLSSREKEVIIKCIEGKTSAESGIDLGISPRTVQSYIENAKNKLGISTREALLENGKVLQIAGLLD